ncbi:hypothetical protein [Embleya sp. NPDC050493]|uniref:hypothetical protein n=1 Tax=Embleya sp. NPDC050493 TaxID=3363989 RepID=UPI0037BB2957
MSESKKSLACIVSVSQSWSSVLKGERPAEEVVLGSWSPLAGRSTTTLMFDPQDVGVVLAHWRGKIVDAYEVDGYTDVTETEGHPRLRVRFTAAKNNSWTHMIGMDSPLHWAQGDGAAVKTLPMADLPTGAALVDRRPDGRRAVLGDATITAREDGTLVVSVPASMPVLVLTHA